MGWQMVEITGINPTICMHKILLEDNFKNNIEGKKTESNNEREVGKKEISSSWMQGLSIKY